MAEHLSGVLNQEADNLRPVLRTSSHVTSVGGRTQQWKQQMHLFTTGDLFGVCKPSMMPPPAFAG